MLDGDGTGQGCYVVYSEDDRFLAQLNVLQSVERWANQAGIEMEFTDMEESFYPDGGSNGIRFNIVARKPVQV